MLRDSYAYGFSRKPSVHGMSRAIGAARSSRVRFLAEPQRTLPRSLARLRSNPRWIQVSAARSAARGLGGGVERETSDGQRFDHALVKRLVEEVVDLVFLLGPRRQAFSHQ